MNSLKNSKKINLLGILFYILFMIRINLQNLSCVKMLKYNNLIDSKKIIKNIWNKIQVTKVYKDKKINHSMLQ